MLHIMYIYNLYIMYSQFADVCQQVFVSNLFLYYFCSVLGNEGQDGNISVCFPVPVHGRMCGDVVRSDPAFPSARSLFLYIALGRRTAEVYRACPRRLFLPIEPGVDEAHERSPDPCCAQFGVSCVRHTAMGMRLVNTGAHLGLAHMARSE